MTFGYPGKTEFNLHTDVPVLIKVGPSFDLKVFGAAGPCWAGIIGKIKLKLRDSATEDELGDSEDSTKSLDYEPSSAQDKQVTLPPLFPGPANVEPVSEGGSRTTPCTQFSVGYKIGL
jgi:hypothetical protein